MKLKDRVAIVTGGGSGIGRAIAIKFSEQGSKLAIVDRKIDLANETVSLIKQPETVAVGIKADVTNYTQVQEMVKTALMTFGKIDILVNNAGWDRFGPFIETTPEFWESILNLNLKGHIYCTRAVLDHMIERKKGVIINIASDAGRVGFRGEVVYSAAKGGLIAFGKALAKEVGEHGIRINSVAPGPTATPMLQMGIEKNQYVFDEMMFLKKQTPLGRFGSPDEVADLVLFLASDESQFITGQVISINGGLTMSG